MKKILCSILLLAGLISLFTTVYSESPIVTDTNDRIGLLEKLDVIEEDDAAALDSPVTRGEFVKMLAELLNIDTTVKSSERYFVDISEDDELWNVTARLIGAGILTVDSDRLFRPNDIIDRSEAACALMKGYGAGAMEYEMYTTIARRMGLLDGVSEGGLSYGDAVNLFYNALVGYPFTYIGSGIAPGSQTFMEIRYDMYYTRGIVNAVNDSVIDGNDTVRNGSMRIGDLAVKCDIDDPYRYMGKNVGAFYTSKDDPKLFYICVDENAYNIEITEKNQPSFNSDTYVLTYCDENGHERTVKLQQNVNVILNGGNASDNVKSAFSSFKSGKITVFSSRSGSGYDTVIIDSYYNVSVMSVSAADRLIYGKDGTVINANADLRPTYITDANGNELALDSIASGSVVSVFESDVYLKLIVSNATVKGAISEKRNQGDDIWLTVEGNEYMVYPGREFLNSPGERVTLYMDHAGYVWDIAAEQKDGMSCGWISNYSVSDDWIDSALYLKIFKDDGTFATYTLAKNTSIDGVMRKTPDLQAAGLELACSGVADQLILFRADENNVIKEIDTCYPNASGGGLIKEFSNSEGTYGSSSVGKLIWAASTTVVFVVPSAENRDVDEAYAIGTKSLLEAWSNNTVDSYRIVNTDKPGAADVLVLHKDLFEYGKEQRGAFVVDGISSAWDEDKQEIREVVTLMSGSAKREYYMADTFNGKNNLIKGNIVTISLNGKNELLNVTLQYGSDSSGNIFETPKEIGSWGDANHYVAIGRIIAVGDDYADLSITDDRTPTVRFPISTTNIGVFDPDAKETCRAGSKGDISEAMAMGDIVAVTLYRGAINSIEIIK